MKNYIPDDEAWSAQNWHLSDTEISRITGRSPTAVWKMRRMLGKPSPQEQRRRQEEAFWRTQNWDLQDVEISKITGRGPATVWEWRHRLRKAPSRNLWQQQVSICGAAPHGGPGLEPVQRSDRIQRASDHRRCQPLANEIGQRCSTDQASP